MSQPPEQGAQQGDAPDPPPVDEVSGPQNVEIFLRRFAADVDKLIDKQAKTTQFIEAITESLGQLRRKTDAKMGAMKSALGKELTFYQTAIDSNLQGFAAMRDVHTDIDRRLVALDAKMDGVRAGLDAELAQQKVILQRAVEQIRYSQNMTSGFDSRMLHLHKKIDTVIYAQMFPPIATPVPAPAPTVPLSHAFTAPAAASTAPVRSGATASLPATQPAPCATRRATADASFATAKPAPAAPCSTPGFTTAAVAAPIYVPPAFSMPATPTSPFAPGAEQESPRLVQDSYAATQ